MTYYPPSLADLQLLLMSGNASNFSMGNSTLNESVLRDILDDHIANSHSLGDIGTLGLVVLYVPMFLVGILGNGCLAVLIFTRSQLRNLTNLFLCNLALADLAVTLICVPIAIGVAIYKIWLYGEFMCKLTGFLQGVTVAASVFTIALLSVDRFVAIRHPMLFRRCGTNRVAVRLIAAVWVMAVALMTPLLFVRKMDVVNFLDMGSVHYCREHWADDSNRQHFDIALFVIVYLIPGIIICTSYGLIGTELWTEDKGLNRSESETSKYIGSQLMRGRKRVARMLIALAVLFALCWLPYYIVSLYLDFHPEDKQLLSVLPYTIFLGHSNSAFNPLLYFYSSKSFRRLLVRMLKCKKKRFKPIRKDNMIVRCTRNPATTTTALTRKPFIRILSNSSLSSKSGSRSGSLRFSRSSNTSLKSSSASNRTSDNSAREKKMDYKNECPAIAIVEPTMSDMDFKDDKHKRAFMACTISIPTTINEESSRRSSMTPCRTPSVSMEAIYQQAPDTEKRLTPVKEVHSTSPTSLQLPPLKHVTFNDNPERH